jgi:seryl-tRNA synthetase
MHDLKAIRQNTEFYRTQFARRNHAHIMDDILLLDEQNRALVTQSQKLQSDRNILSKEIGVYMSKKMTQEAEQAKESVAHIKDTLTQIEKSQGEIAEKLHHILVSYPNILSDDVPNGASEDDNKEIASWGTPRVFDFTPLEHDEIGKNANGMDFETASDVSGARFVYLKHHYARLERALTQFMLDIHTQEFGYTEISPPVLVREKALFGTGQLPKFADDLYHAGDEHYLIPTAEVSLTNMVAGKILSESDMPIRLTAATPCFRSEAGSAGKDTRGIIRQHQFTKVELVSIVPPEMSDIEHQRMTDCATSVLQRLNLPYRIMVLCSGDTGFSAHKTFDIEVWLPGQGKYREISSCSNCTDFQARRMNARYKNADGKNEAVHTLNGSALAVGRTMVAVIENYQNADGSVTIPDALLPYMGGISLI